MRNVRGKLAGAATVAVVPLLAASALAISRLLQGDVHYALGGLETGSRGGFAISDIFIARPYVYALALEGLSRIGDAVTSSSPSAGYEVAIMVATSIVVALIGVLLYAGLRRYVLPSVAATIAIFITAATIVTPAWTFLQPDWLGVVCSVFALAAALAPRRDSIAMVLGGLGVGLTIAVKLATAPWALMALIVVALFSWRRAIGAAVAGAVISVVWMELTKHFQPLAWTWLQDQVKLVSDSPLNHAPRLHDYTELARASMNAALVNPIVIVAPAAALALVMHVKPGRQRVVAVLAAVALAGLSVGSPFGQGEYFMYHFAGTPVAAAGAVGAAIALVPRSRLVLIPASILAAIGALTLMSQSVQWRNDHAVVAGAFALIVALLATAAVAMRCRTRRWTSGSTALPRVGVSASAMLVATVTLAAALAAPNLPSSHFSFDGYNKTIGLGQADAQGLDRSLASAARLRQRLGGDTVPVLYLTYGAFNYFLGNPSVCQYPSPQWVQRATRPAAAELQSYRSNLKCVQDPGPAKFAIIDTRWFRLKALPQEVQSDIAKNFDCTASGGMFKSGNTVFCPRKTPTTS